MARKIDESSSLLKEELDVSDLISQTSQSENEEKPEKVVSHARKKRQTKSVPDAKVENEILNSENLKNSETDENSLPQEIQAIEPEKQEGHQRQTQTKTATEVKSEKSSEKEKTQTKKSSEKSKTTKQANAKKEREKERLAKERQKEEKRAKKEEERLRKADEPKISDFFKAFENPNKKRKNFVPRKVKRVKTNYQDGLSRDLVEERIEKCQTNEVPNTNVKTIGSIIRENVFTFFNALCFIVFAALVVVDIMYDQSWSNILFMVIIVVNIVIGIAQEVRAKKTIEKLSLLTAPTVKVVRDGIEQTISQEEVVIDDIVILSTGKQIVADCIVVEGNVEVNESILTGESLPIKKKVGDTILAGSYVVAGKCHARVDKVGINNYIQQLSASAKQYKKPKSELFSSLKLIVKVIGILIVPITVAMFFNNYKQPNSTIASAVTATAGSIIGMIPAGMFLLCSVSLTVSVIKLANKKALVQDLYCVEMLARVNVLCLDKTGTITDGTMKVYNCVQLTSTEHTIKRIMGSMLSALGDNNATSQALINFFGYNKELTPTITLPFSSTRKLSAVTFAGAGTYIMGAPEFVFPNLKDEKIKHMIEQYAKDGYRVLILASSPKSIVKDTIPDQREAIAIIVLEDHIRDNVSKTIAWFKNNGVKIKIISGDNPLTVSEIARRVGVDGTDSFISLDGLNEKQVIAAANKYTVFGRVTPEQKALLVRTIHNDGHTVAMTGDGVNDILALKEADCSIAMASGNEAVRSVSHMVLLNSDFSSMPDTVLEGRKVINNVQKSSSLFFMKTLFTLIFSLFVLALRQPYPFTTSNTLIFEWFIIGIPSFLLAFLPNTKPIEGKFIYNLVKNAFPGALTLVINIAAIYLFNYFVNGSISYNMPVVTTMATIILTTTGLAMLYRLCKPFNGFTTTVFVVMFALCITCIILWPEFFGMISIVELYKQPNGLSNILFILLLSTLAPTIIAILHKMLNRVSIK